MKRKFLKAVLFTVAMATVSGTFVSCKDYDDDIKDLQEQINQKALASDVTALQSQVQSALSAAQSALAEAQKKADATAVADLEKRVAALEAAQKELANLKAEIEAATQAKMDEMQKKFDEMKKKVEDMVGTMLTSIHLYVDPFADGFHDDNYNIRYSHLNFAVTEEQDNTFGPNGEATFKKGNIVTYTQSLLVRVSPANADLSAAELTLVNTQGADMKEFLTLTAAPYNKKDTYAGFGISETEKTRATSASGVWTVKVKLNENYNSKALKDAYLAKNQAGDYASRVKFAVAACNTEDATRNIVSEFDVTLEVSSANSLNEIPANTKVNGILVADIHNRYHDADQDITKANSELVWLNGKTAVKAIRKTEGNDVVNVALGDNRSEKNIIRVEAGKAFPIQIALNAWGGVATEIKGFYVTLDEAFAGAGCDNEVTYVDKKENSVSEINAWHSYEYANLGTYQPGNSGSVTVKNMKNVASDVIGFRIYAVNMDGTLLDPDGAAFYVFVANEGLTDVIEAEATIAEKGAQFIGFDTTVDLSKLTEEAINKLKDATWTTGNNGANPAFTVEFGKMVNGAFVSTNDPKEIKVAKLAIPVADTQKFKDNATYTQTATVQYGTDGVNSITITAKLTKKMPTAAPKGFLAKDKQIVNGVYTAYLYGQDKSYQLPVDQPEGFMAMENAFNGLLVDNAYVDGYTFTFADAAWKNKTEKTTKDIVANKANSYVLDVKDINDFLGKEYATSVTYDYGAISSEKDEDDNLVTEYLATVSEFKTKFACWHMAQSAYTWEKYLVAEATETTPAVYQEPTNSAVYGLTTNVIDLNTLVATNSYNNSLFGGQLFTKLMDAKKYLTLVEGTVTSKASGLAEYFTVTVADAQKVALAPVKVDEGSNPTADVPSTLKLTFKDLFGHKYVIESDFTVKPQ